MSDLSEKVKKSIERLKAFCPEEGYYLAFSGGKDSVTCKALLDMAGVKYDATYRVTSVDPPELVRFIKEQHPDVIRAVPRDKDGKPITMWNLIPRKMMPPTGLARFCCEKLKESGGDGRMTVTGVRWAESTNRKQNQGLVTLMGTKGQEAPEGFRVSPRHQSLVLVNDNEDTRKMVESCYKRHKTTVNPIIDWTDQDVWTFIKANKIPYCSLYDEGFQRLGCVGCPMASRKERERHFRRWPKFKDAYMRAFDEMIKRRIKRHEEDPTRPVWRQGGTDTDYATAQDVFNWWMEYDILAGQYSLFDDNEEDDDDP